MEKRSTRDRILQEAERQFIEKGIAGSQMKEIAEGVGINRRTLYRYFPSKDELAFEIEMIVMNKIQDYLNLKMEDAQGKKGYEKIGIYFGHMNFEQIKDLMKYTAEFDRYFQDEYPTPQLEDTFLRSLNPRDDQLYQFIEEGRADGSVRKDLTTDQIFHFISQNFFALFQRLILREKHLKNEYCDNIDFQKLFRDILLRGISSTD